MLINGGGDQPNGEEPHPSRLWVGTLHTTYNNKSRANESSGLLCIVSPVYKAYDFSIISKCMS